MAFRKDIRLNCSSQLLFNGNTFDGDGGVVSVDKAYVKIVRISGSKERLFIEINVSNGETSLFLNYDFRPSVADDSENFIKQGYEYLKTLPEFEGATDC